jgi:arylsulfatase A-like enzyme
LILLGVLAAGIVSAANKPNIVFILADDLGYSDIGCYGSKYYETPNIDNMAKHGMRFTDAHTAAPNCQPSRAAMMSGEYEPRTGVYTVGNIDRFDWRSRPLRPVDNVAELPLDKVTVAQALKSAGYDTGMFGKWHLGEDEKHHPLARGFDEAIVSMGIHFDFETNPKTDYPKGEYLADFLTDKAVDFIHRHKNHPFFLYLPHYAVHTPLQAKENLIEKFKNKTPSGGQNNPTYAAMIASVDESVGRVMATLKELKLDDNTLVIFSSDNGGVGGYHREGIEHLDVTDNSPLRGGKGMLYEGGHRVPYVFYWPGKIPEGKTCDQVISGIDLYPTLLEIAGAKTPKNYPLDGVSYAKLLTGKKTKLNRDAIYWHFPGYLGAKPGSNTWRTTPVGAIRSGDWQLLEFFEDHHIELYNLKNDLGEKHNLASENPAKAKELQEKLIAWRSKMNAKMPTPNKPMPPAQPKKKGKKKKAPGNA